MSLFLSSNKPRSLHRPITTSINNDNNVTSLEHSLDEWFSRSNSSQSTETLNDGASITSTTSTITTTNCPCCQSIQCDSWRNIRKMIRKLETETRLAAEIGQSLLQKNDVYLMESNQLKERFEQCQERKQELEISLDETERFAQQLHREKDKWMWQYEKSEKILNESVADLENTNNKCAALTEELERTKSELEKLQLFKVKSHQFDSREDTLQSKLEDTTQELIISRKNEMVLESKYKKLMARYESLSYSSQDTNKPTLKTKFNIKSLSTITTPTVADIQRATTDELHAFINELLSTNTSLKNELLNTTARLEDARNEAASLQDQDMNMGKGITKSTKKANNKSNSNVRHSTFTNNQTTSSTTIINNDSRSRRHRSTSTRMPRSKSVRDGLKSSSSSSMRSSTSPIPQTTTSTPVVHHHYHYYLRQRKQSDTLDEEPNQDIVPTLCRDQHCDDLKLPTPFPSSMHTKSTAKDESNFGMISPITLSNIDKTHNHYHHQDAEEIQQINTLDDTFVLSPSSSAPVSTTERPVIITDLHQQTIPLSQSPPLTTLPETPSSFTPYTTLLNQARAVLQRLQSTDTRTLNRRLQRAFDITELSNMSNAILQNIVTDVDTMDARFIWLAPDENNNGNNDDPSMINEKASDGRQSYTFSFLVNEFFCMVQLLQELLQEIGQLSITINHLQVAYVKKVEENEIRVQQEVMEKYQQITSQQQTSSNDTTSSLLPATNPSIESSAPSHLSSTPIHWLASLFTSNNVNTSTTTTTTTTTDYVTLLSHHSSGHLHPTTTTSQQTERHPDKKNIHTNHHHHYPHTSYPLDNNSNIKGGRHHPFWPSISLILDELRRSSMIGSSSLDREWYWTCSDGLSASWLENKDY
ncbi:uncharacterized protein BX664DRAFT_340480 [Halteromyces radiatus]|uniref:uncharacterized protein n=1 Tax=Halteromyces radiatus TaxID=101107 RepID=UPI00221EE82F|nr:uncharacterized protein BX664DRAFT_340480 [Halteromyces radiatus]KAI8081475.1 hypothetical protein BX664DRAFT_340480 [Halteromyces radiatus]